MEGGAPVRYMEIDGSGPGKRGGGGGRQRDSLNDTCQSPIGANLIKSKMNNERLSQSGIWLISHYHNVNCRSIVPERQRKGLLEVVKSETYHFEKFVDVFQPD